MAASVALIALAVLVSAGLLIGQVPVGLLAALGLVARPHRAPSPPRARARAEVAITRGRAGRAV